MDIATELGTISAAVSSCFLGYLYHRSNQQKREFAHAERLKALETGQPPEPDEEAREAAFKHTERMKALETGQPVPEVETAWAGTENARVQGAAFVGIFVTMSLIGGACVATWLVLNHVYAQAVEPAWIALVLYVIWGVSGLVSLVTVTLSFASIMRNRRPSAVEAPTRSAEKPRIADHAGNVNESPMSFTASEKQP